MSFGEGLSPQINKLCSFELGKRTLETKGMRAKKVRDISTIVNFEHVLVFQAGKHKQ